MEEDDAGYHRELGVNDLVAAFTHMSGRRLAAGGGVNVPEPFKRRVFRTYYQLPFQSAAGLRALNRRDSLQWAPATLFLGFVQTSSLLVKASSLSAAKQRGGPLLDRLNCLPQNCGDSTLLQELSSSFFIG